MNLGGGSGGCVGDCLAAAHSLLSACGWHAVLQDDLPAGHVGVGFVGPRGVISLFLSSLFPLSNPEDDQQDHFQDWLLSL